MKPVAENAIEKIETVAEVSFFPELDRNELVQGESDLDLEVGENNLEGSCGQD